MPKRKHYDLIIAWANGADIQYYSEYYNCWINTKYPTFDDSTNFRLAPKPHIHQELIDAYNQGAKIQYYSKSYKQWQDIIDPSWYEDSEYRIKKTPEEVYSESLEKHKQNLNFGTVDIFNNVIKDIIEATKSGMFD